MSTEKNEDYDFADLDQLIEDARVRSETEFSSQAEREEVLKWAEECETNVVDHDKVVADHEKVVVGQIDSSELARLRGQLIELLERAAPLARQIGMRFLASLIEQTCADLRE